MSYHYASFFLNDVLLVRAIVRNCVSIPNFEQQLTRKRERIVQIQVWINYAFYLLIPANTLTVQLVSTTRQRSGWLSQPGFKSRHHLLKTKIRGTSLPLVESFFLIMNYKLFPWCFSPNCDFAGTRYGTTETRVRGWISAVAFMTQSRMSILSLMRVALLRLGSSLSLDFLSF